MQEKDSPAHLPPRFVLDWSPIEELLGRKVSPSRFPEEDPWYGFRDQIEGDAWQLVLQSWETRSKELERVAGKWRNTWRRGRSAMRVVQQKSKAGQRIAPRSLFRYAEGMLAALVAPLVAQRGRGRPFSLTWFDSIILWFDSIFPKLECTVNYDRSVYGGQFPEIIFEIIRQISPFLKGRPRVVGLPDRIHLPPVGAEGNQESLNAIGRRMEELRKGERRDAKGRRLLRANELFWRRH
ncbi:MAG: hypothetical protein NT005_02615 [Spirochaetes bacterium]|nr:hypothetical protein [Spirochaetota bacterium]